MPISAFIVKVPEAEALVGALRERYDATTALGVPAHVRLLVPFMPPSEIDDEVLRLAREALAQTRAFDFSLHQIGRFPDVAYLPPDPAEPFVAMTRALVRAFPSYPPYGGAHQGIVAHLTVAHGSAVDAENAASELQRRLVQHGPVSARCDRVVLVGNASGRWADLHTFALG